MMVILFLSLTILIAYFDYKENIIPNAFTFPGIIAGLTFTFTNNRESFISSVAFIVFLFFFGMLGIINMGDLKLWMMLVAFTGYKTGTYLFGAGLALTLLYGLLINPSENMKKMQLGIYAAQNNLSFNKQGELFPIGFFTCIACICFEASCLLLR